jgi:hypothetical protein
MKLFGKLSLVAFVLFYAVCMQASASARAQTAPQTAGRLAQRAALSPIKAATVVPAQLAAPTAPMIAPPAEFRADYELFRNGKLMGASHISLSKTRRGYQFETLSESEGGWASLVGGAEIKESSEFSIQGAQFLPLSYSYRQSVSFKKRKREISYDWSKKQAREDDGDNVVTYLLPAGTLDRNLVVLALAQDLKAKRASLDHMVAYKGEAITWQFKNAGVEKVATAMGTIEANRVERVRENKGRSTTSWHAAAYDFLPIKIEQREPNGDSIEMRIKSIQIQSTAR